MDCGHKLPSVCLLPATAFSGWMYVYIKQNFKDVFFFGDGNQTKLNTSQNAFFLCPEND